LRLRDVVDIPNRLSAQLILDQQIGLFTKEKREVAARVDIQLK
jgi:hypothetical protein